MESAKFSQIQSHINLVHHQLVPLYPVFPGLRITERGKDMKILVAANLKRHDDYIEAEAAPDKVVTQECGFLDHINVILANGGFNISDERGAKLEIPS